MSRFNRDEISSVPGSPEKNFFVNMLTRDIELHDAVLDLLDNCVDGAHRSRPKKLANEDSLTGFWAKITLSADKFIIEDNCGGIPWEIAHNYAFRMGKPQEFEKPEGTIGVVGIGMKRAIFKIGRSCDVHSNHKNDSFMVSITPNWFNEPVDWDFPAEREETTNKKFGTIIEISELTPETSQAFEKGSAFRQKFESTIGESYSYLIAKGFEISVNEAVVKRKSFELCNENVTPDRNDSIRPFIYKTKIGNVDVFMAAGYRSRFKSEDELDKEKEGGFAAQDAGWTIICNDRVVLSNDRSSVTGWGFGGVPFFHNQFASLAGVVEFRSNDTRQLPLTTTKRGVDAGKEVYVKTLHKMQEATKHFTRNTNRWKGSEPEIKGRFDAAERLGLSKLKDLAKKLSLSAIPGTSGKQFKPKLPEKKRITTTARISFIKPKTEIEAVSCLLFDEVRESSTVGEACFDRILSESKA